MIKNDPGDDNETENHRFVGEGDLVAHHMTVHEVHRASTMPLLQGIPPTGREVHWTYIHIWLRRFVKPIRPMMARISPGHEAKSAEPEYGHAEVQREAFSPGVRSAGATRLPTPGMGARGRAE